MASGLIRNIFGELVDKPVQKSAKRGIGCLYCSLNEVPGLVKIKGLKQLAGRRVMLWAQSPGSKENEQRVPLVGATGKFVVNTLASVGFKRDMFDVQYVLRCRPWNGKSEHEPTNDELRCCSVYNEEALALNDHKAVLHIILGETAGKRLLKKRYKKGSPLIWMPEWNAYAVITENPGYIRHIDEGTRTSWLYREFRDRLKAARNVLRYPGRWGYLKAQDYGSVTKPSEMKWLEAKVHAEVAAGRRISIDLEDGEVNGKPGTPLIIGIGWGHYVKNERGHKVWKGGARAVVLEHPEADTTHLAYLKRRLAKIVADPKIKKTLQHGSYDMDPSGRVDRIGSYLGVRSAGYDFDTQYAAFLYDSNLRSYSLDNLAKHWFLDFADYKQIAAQHFDPKAEHKNYATIPLDDLILYNCADCDITKRIEERVATHISLPLLQVYIQVAFVLDKMEKTGPYLDKVEHERLEREIPKLMGPILQKLQILSKNKQFNPAAPDQVAEFIYETLGLPELEEFGRSTKDNVLSILYQQTKHPGIALVRQWRTLNTIMGTFMVGYKRSASMHKGLLLTVWKLTGAATGRLRSGKSDEAEREEGVINLQNTHGNPILQNLLVSDPNWRIALKD